MAFRFITLYLPHGDGQGLPVLDLEWIDPSSDMVGVSRCRGVTSLPRLLARDLEKGMFAHLKKLTLT